MRLVSGLDGLKPLARRSVVTVGMFDGVHIGHQRLIHMTVRLARRAGHASVVITFDPDPQQTLDPPRAQLPLTPLRRRLQLIQALGVDLIWMIPFTTAFSRTTPEEFVRRILVERLRSSCIVVGGTFAFGMDRRGNLPLLQRLGRETGMRVVVLRPVVRGGEPVSSSRIRRLVQTGEVQKAQRLLGRPGELWGTVVRGDQRGRVLGFPTANVRLDSPLLPPRGVYQVWLEHAGRREPGLMNLGVRPTFGDSSSPGSSVCEVHLVGFEGNLYGRQVTIGLLKRLRDERRFDSQEALIRQIRRDLARAGLAALANS